MTQRPWVVVVGGFLGSGKTSLILAASHILAQRGLRCAVILNDQSNELVDTRQTEAHSILSQEVAGGCFCCRFSDLVSAMEKIRSHAPDVIFAEPVGSCTDISATVLAPLHEEFHQYRLAPFTVLVDPARAASLTGADAGPHLSFLFQKQLQEADLVCMSKSDLYPDAAKIPDVEARYVSAKTGQGVQEWIDEVLSGNLEAGTKTLEIDYDQYARAEAALAWLNSSFVYEPAIAVSPAVVVGQFLDFMDEALTAAGISIVHLKIFDHSFEGWLKAGICANGEEPTVDGALDASSANRHEMLVNLRAAGDSDRVREIVEAQMDRLKGDIECGRMECFRPLPPKPERRLIRN